MNSRDKGVKGERELANYLKERGVEARRGQQHAGGGDSPDVLSSWTDTHIECKRTRNFALYDAMDQAIRDSAGTGRVPIVAHRSDTKPGDNLKPVEQRSKSRGKWLVVISLDDFIRLKQTADVSTLIKDFI